MERPDISQSSVGVSQLPPVTVGIATLDRADALRDLLTALQWQTYPQFEVIVVPGPCSDHTDQVLEEFAEHITVIRNAERNVSIARNLVLAAASCEFVAFIDDDAIPHATWLERLIAGFTDPTVAATGGPCLAQDGRRVDWRYTSVDGYGIVRASTVDRRSTVVQDTDDPLRTTYPYFSGTNMAFRCDVLRKHGGFDEATSYYHDDTIVAYGLGREGWRFNDTEATVHHRFLAGVVRASDDARTTNWMPILRGQAHFLSRFALPAVGIERCEAALRSFAAEMRGVVAPDESPMFDHALVSAVNQLVEQASHEDHAASPVVQLNVGPPRWFGRQAVDTHSRLVVVCVDEAASEDAVDLATAAAARGEDVHLVVVTDPNDRRTPTSRWTACMWRHTLGASSTSPTVWAEVERLHRERTISRLVVVHGGRHEIEIAVESIWGHSAVAVKQLLGLVDTEVALRADNIELRRDLRRITAECEEWKAEAQLHQCRADTAEYWNDVYLDVEASLRGELRRVTGLFDVSADYAHDLEASLAAREVALRQSLSWRITGPVRAIASRIRPVLRPLRRIVRRVRSVKGPRPIGAETTRDVAATFGTGVSPDAYRMIELLAEDLPKEFDATRR